MSLKRSNAPHDEVLISAMELIDEGQQRGAEQAILPFHYTYHADTHLDQVYYYEYDHLGNTRATFSDECKDHNGDGPDASDEVLEELADYYPYGKILREFVNGREEKYLTTHHERDQETGLDYRGARYYDSDLARFLSLDPKAPSLTEWSPYNYVIGNPVSVIDPDGKWPFWIHARIIREALGDLMDRGMIDLFIQGSLYTDGKGNKVAQSPDYSFTHFMRGPKQTKEEANQLSQRFIEDQKTKYKTTDDYVDACWKLSQGGHCVADNTSPSHSGSQLWRGVKWYRPDHWMFAGVHIVRELNLFHMSERRVQAAEEQLRSYVLSAIKERQEMGKSERVVDDTDRLVPDKLKDKGL